MNGNGNGRKRDRFLPPRLLQVVGLGLLISSAVFWAFTGRESIPLLSAAMSLIMLGAYGEIVGGLRSKTEDSP